MQDISRCEVDRKERKRGEGGAEWQGLVSCLSHPLAKEGVFRKPRFQNVKNNICVPTVLQLPTSPGQCW